MAALIIRIEEHQINEHHAECDSPHTHKAVGFSILSNYDGELAVGDCLPGIEPLLVRAIRGAIDTVFGSSVDASNESIEDAQMQIENRRKRFIH
jgi:hypothetical protein